MYVGLRFSFETRPASALHTAQTLNHAVAAVVKESKDRWGMHESSPLLSLRSLSREVKGYKDVGYGCIRSRGFRAETAEDV